jgi:hypothetical protein
MANFAAAYWSAGSDVGAGEGPLMRTGVFGAFAAGLAALYAPTVVVFADPVEYEHWAWSSVVTM